MPDCRDTYVQYGCGLSAPEGWINFDSSPRLRFERTPLVAALVGCFRKPLFPQNVRYGDILKGLPVADVSADAVYSSHVLEHLSRRDVTVALRNTLRILRPGGVFRVVVPDLHWRASRYLRERETGNVQAAERFVLSTNLGLRHRPKGVMALLRAAYGSSGHRWFYDELSLRALLEESGFVNIRRCSLGDSGDDMFTRVESERRFVDDGDPGLGLHALRPET